MNRNMNLKIVLLALAALFLSACQTIQTEDVLIEPSGVEGQPGSGVDADGVGIADDGSDPNLIPIVDEPLTAQEMLEQADTPLANRTIYFEFDSARITDESMAMLEAHGNFVAANGNVKLRLEGHADERGSREYNIALGDRRAQSVRRVFLLLGASSDQLDTVSYGEEQPAMRGHNEEAWAMNRRVELVYTVN